MPVSSYERLDEKLDKVLAEFNGEHGIHARLGRMEERHEGYGRTLNELVERVGRQNGRVRKLEVWRGWMAGAMLVGGGILGVFGKELFDHITK
jgi:hypothetical protein